MTSGKQIGWFVPAGEYDRFLQFVESERGDRDRYGWVFAENAMREFMDADTAHDLEQMVNEAIEAGGYTLSEIGQEKKSFSTTGPLRDEETVQVNLRVDPDLRERFMAYVKEHTDLGTRYGLALGYALREYRENNRTERLIEKYRRVHDDITDLMDAFGDGDTSGDITTVEKRTIKFCMQIREKGLAQVISRNDLREIIGERYTTEETIDQYEETIMDRMGFTEHPNNPALLIREDEAEQKRIEAAEAALSTIEQAQQVRSDGGRDMTGGGA